MSYVRDLVRLSSSLLTMGRNLQHLSPRGSGLLVQLGPQNGRSLCRAPTLTADSDLVLGDVVIQAGQEVLRQVVASIDAPVVADELIACHLLGHLQHG